MIQRPSPSIGAFIRYAWCALGVTLLVIVWGAVVRATGSGAGCGSHWPLCNGVVVPLAPTAGTIIEFVHRLTSGGAMLLSLGLLVWARRLFAAGHPARRWASISFFFMLLEAAIGAGIVLLRLVEDNASALRAAYVGGHLVNTLLLIGAMLTTIWWSRPIASHPRLRSVLAPGIRSLTLCLVAMLAVAATGAVVALGDTLFPHASLAEGFAADFDPTSHFLIRLRVWHPLLAALVATYLLFAASGGHAFAGPDQRHPRRLVITFVLLQTALGIVNLWLLAPLALQMAHLFMSNLLWMTLVWGWWGARMVGSWKLEDRS
jgi:heme A synthase